MRRRALMARHYTEFDPIAPEITTVDQLKRVTGQLANDYEERFPRRGAIYILRENPEDIEDDDR